MHKDNLITEDKDTVNGDFVEIPISLEDILNCTYSSWYSKFSAHTLSRVEIIKPIPNEFINYLESDNILLPKGAPHESALFQDIHPNSDNDYSDWDDDENVQRTGNTADPTENFPDFHQNIKSVISNFKSVAPKLNWSAPQDSTWIMTNKTMQCFSASDLYLLLKSSDYVNYDLCHAFDGVKPAEKQNVELELELVLREWVEMNPSMEFRCFVRDRQLIAICQRDLNYYSFLKNIQDEVTEKIGVFFDDILLSKFESNSFVFDVYIPKPFNKVYLIDINPFFLRTDPLLFTWNELATITPDEDDVDFRLVTEYNSGRFASKAHSQNHVPRDFVDASYDTNAMIEFLKKCKDLELKRSFSDSESDNEEEAVL